MAAVCSTPPCGLAQSDMQWCSQTCLEQFMRAQQAPLDPDDTHDPRHGQECRKCAPSGSPTDEEKRTALGSWSWLAGRAAP